MWFSLPDKSFCGLNEFSMLALIKVEFHRTESGKISISDENTSSPTLPSPNITPDFPFLLVSVWEVKV